MTRMRFQLVAIAATAFGGAIPAHAQAAARIDDIQLSREGETISILVKLSQQPTAASAKAAGDDLLIEIDGVDLAKLALDPPAGSLVRHVEAGGRKLSLSGAAFGEASTVIYRNAVLVEAKLADPKLRGPSLMTPAAAPPARPAPVQPPAKPVEAESHPKTPADDKPIDLVKRPQPHPAPVVAAPHAPPAPAKPKSSTAALASIDAARCTAAAADVGKDPWAIPALGDHALCLIDQGKTKEAGSRLDQLAAFAPEDWRVALGRAALAAEKGDSSTAEIGYRTAASLAPTETIRAAINGRMGAHGDTP
jgi:hypothetical protein